MEDNEGNCLCQPSKNDCEKCKNDPDRDHCQCKLLEYLAEYDEDDYYDCPSCLEVHFGCDCGCGGDFYTPEDWDAEIEKCPRCSKDND